VKSRAAAICICLMLVLAACGARLTREQKLAGIGSLSGGASETTGSAVGPGVNPTTGETVGSGGTTGSAAGPGTTGGPAASACGNPSTNPASDTGVAKNQITVATASDVSGVQAALFKSTHQAMSALAAMVNSQGGICGRAIRPLLLDTKADSSANASQVQQACDDAFALVGSMSAFDNGGADAGERCGIPDLTAITVNGARVKASNVYPIYPIRPDKLGIGTANYIKEKYPDVIKKAAMVYLNANVTKTNALQRVRGYESVGFDFGSRIYEVQVLEPNYSVYVQKMRDAGVEYVSMVANYQSIQRLLQEMEKANWFPKVRDWDSVAYSPLFVTQNKRRFTAANGSLVFLNTAISEEASGNPEMQLYNQWLGRVAPGAKPDYFGFYAWSAGRLFVKLATQVGAKLTRKALLDAVKKVNSWDGNGLHAAHNIAAKLMSPCFLYLEIKNSRFVRKDPSQGFTCNKGGIVNT
jgi:ABC-type branched-subunit amino acid transport system substrate-binding protein